MSLVVISIAKFRLGAWQVMILIPILAWLLRMVRVHYGHVSAALRAGPGGMPKVRATKAVVLVSSYPGATTKAVAFTRAFAPKALHVLAFRVPEKRLRAIRQRWSELGIKIPIEATGHRREDLAEFVRGLNPTETDPVTVVMAAPSDELRLRQVVRNRSLLRIRQALLSVPGVVVASVPYIPDLEPPLAQLRAPGRLSIVVVVSAVQQATLRALSYAKSLRPSELKALSVALDPEDAVKLTQEWEHAGIDIPLEIVDSPFRSLTRPLLNEIRKLSPNPNDAVGVVIPEPVVKGWLWKPLHGQRALLIKATLLFEQHVLVFDVPYQVGLTRSPDRGPGEHAGAAEHSGG